MASPEPLPTPTLESPARWSEPQHIMRNDRYGQLSMVIDRNGAVHAAATVGSGIVYLTNASGGWVQTQLSVPPESDHQDRSPSIAIDTDGRVAVAFARARCTEMGCFASDIFLVMNESGQWSEPETIAGGGDPSLQLRDGSVHLAYVAWGIPSDVACEHRVPIRYMTNVTGDWTDVRVARHGNAAIIRLGSDGLPRIMLHSYCDFLGSEGIYYAATTSPTAPFALEPIAGTTPRNNSLVDMVLDPIDRPHAIYWRFTDEDAADLYLVRDDGGWVSSELDVPTTNVVSIATGADGAAHVLAQGDSGTWYLTDRDGAFRSQQLSDEFSVRSNAARIGVDPSGRPHVLFTTGNYDRTKPGLWYVIGPAQ